MGLTKERILPKQRIWILASVLISGICFYLANELSGDFGYFMWFAPVPVLICSFYTSGKTTFLIAFISNIIGRLSWFSYLVSIITVVPTVLFSISFSLIFALLVIANRRIVQKTNAWYSIFAFPVLFTIFEFLLLKYSPDGSAGSIAYSQSNYLPIIQIASITGILGITFLITLISSAIATGWYFRKNRYHLRLLSTASILIFSIVFLYGYFKIRTNTKNESLKVGLTVLDESFHNITEHPDFQKEKLATEFYSKQVRNLAQQGAKIVLLPERAININKETEKEIIAMFSKTAKQYHVYIITGYTNFRTDKPFNSSLVIDTSGSIIGEYNKIHLVKGLEDLFLRGNKTVFFNFNHQKVGIPICKDLDFPSYISQYSQVSFLTIPAWDFVVDGWLHSRMAILRSVENGFSEIRTARQGRLTISDCYGRIVNEVDCSNGKAISLIGNLPLQKENTFYSRFGDWFILPNFMGLILFLSLFFRKKSTLNFMV